MRSHRAAGRKYRLTDRAHRPRKPPDGGGILQRLAPAGSPAADVNPGRGRRVALIEVGADGTPDLCEVRQACGCRAMGRQARRGRAPDG